MRSCCRGGRGDSARMRSCCRGRAWGYRAARVHRGHEKARAELVHASSAFLQTTLTIYFRSRGRSQSCLLMGRGAAQVCPAQRWAKWQSSLAPVGQSTFNEPTFSNKNVCARHPPRAVDRKHIPRAPRRENAKTSRHVKKTGARPRARLDARPPGTSSLPRRNGARMVFWASRAPRTLRQSPEPTPQGRPRAPACETVANAMPAMTSRLSGLEKSLLE